MADSFAIFSAVGFRSLIKIFSIFNSFATRNPLAPTPDNASKKIFGPSNFFKNAEYAIIEKSLFVFAFGLKNAGLIGGTFSVNYFFGTNNFVSHSIISWNNSFASFISFSSF